MTNRKAENMTTDIEGLRTRHAAAVAAKQDANDRLTLAREAAVQAALDGLAIPSICEARAAVRDANHQAEVLTVALARATGETMTVPTAVYRAPEEILAA